MEFSHFIEEIDNKHILHMYIFLYTLIHINVYIFFKCFMERVELENFKQAGEITRTIPAQIEDFQNNNTNMF